MAIKMAEKATNAVKIPQRLDDNVVAPSTNVLTLEFLLRMSQSITSVGWTYYAANHVMVSTTSILNQMVRYLDKASAID